MLRAYSQKQRCFTRGHKSDSMMKENVVQSKSLSRGIGNYFHLMLGHDLVSLVIDPSDLAAVFHFSNHSEKIDNRSGSRRIDIFFRRFQARLGQQNLRNGVCHAFESLVTM